MKDYVTLSIETHLFFARIMKEHALFLEAGFPCCEPEDPFSRVIPLQGGISIGNTFTMEVKDGASCPGDYLYRSGSLKWDVESGMWGIFRVIKQGVGCKCKNACHRLWKRICKTK